MKVYDFEKYRQRKQLKDKLSELEEAKSRVYSEYNASEQQGYEKFKRLIEILVLEEEGEDYEEEEE